MSGIQGLDYWFRDRQYAVADEPGAVDAADSERLMQRDPMHDGS